MVVVPIPATFVLNAKTPERLIVSPTLILPVVPIPVCAIIVEPTLIVPLNCVEVPTIAVVPNPTIEGKFAEENTVGLSILSVIVSPTCKFDVPPLSNIAKLALPTLMVPKNSLTIFAP